MSNFDLELFDSLFSKFELIERKFDTPGIGYINVQLSSNFGYKIIKIEGVLIPFITQENQKDIERFNFNFPLNIQRLIETKFCIKPETIYSQYLKIYYGWNKTN